MSKYEVTLDRRGTSVAPWDAKEVVEADSMQRADRHITLLAKQSEVVAVFPTDRVVSIIKLDVDPKDETIADLRSMADALTKTSKSLVDENKRLRKLKEPRIRVWRQHRLGAGRDEIFDLDPGVGWKWSRSGYTYEVK